MQISIVLGVIFAPLTYWLYRHFVAMGYNRFEVNAVIGLVSATVWYFINRRLFSGCDADVTRTAGGSFAWWALSFSAHQAIFAAALGLIGLPYILVKGTEVGFQPPEFFAKYWFTKKKLFVSKTEV